MILADKITELRKKAGWSQEELAAQLCVSRQSVSKWEGAQSVPDMEKILQLSNLFGVSTDYLLKDEITQPETKTASSITAQTAADYGETKPLRRVSMEEASEYIRLRKESALKNRRRDIPVHPFTGCAHPAWCTQRKTGLSARAKMPPRA